MKRRHVRTGGQTLWHILNVTWSTGNNTYAMCRIWLQMTNVYVCTRVQRLEPRAPHTYMTALPLSYPPFSWLWGMW